MIERERETERERERDRERQRERQRETERDREREMLCRLFDHSILLTLSRLTCLRFTEVSGMCYLEENSAKL